MLTFEQTDEGVAVLRLNRPEKKNALSRELRDAIVDRLTEIAADESVRSVVITGTGDVFCAGFDLEELAAGDSSEIFAQAQAYHRCVYTFAKPLVAAINGPAYAGGMDLALMCDLRVAAETAVFGQPQVRMGIPAAYELIRTVLPEPIARQICLSGQRMDAQEALRTGLVNAISKPAEVVEDALTLASAVAASTGAAAMKAQFVRAQPELFGAPRQG